MLWRHSVALLLVGFLMAAVAGSAALGATASPSPRSAKAQSERFRSAIDLTFASQSLTAQFAGQRIIYQAPDRIREVEAGPDTTGFGSSLVASGSVELRHASRQPDLP